MMNTTLSRRMIDISLLGPFTGDFTKPYSFQVGPHWKDFIGFRVVEGTDHSRHFFGGQTWELPICPNCKESLHQIFTFDLSDPRLAIVRIDNLKELPLISCLNCSYYWEPQTFKLDPIKNQITILHQNNTQNWEMDAEDKIPSPLPRMDMKLMNMFKGDIPVDDESYESAFESFGDEYICRLLGAPLYASGPIDRECPCCSKEMIYVSTITGETYGNERNAISTVDFVIGESLIYFLFCKDCLLLKTEVQST
ncbi:hypothetical protein [Brevibacillus dissolubilis]|uniref:hypothetical protein n=1 Tax=Brevibacillus dissolubilis TaxID=1844116 RepID=UPI0020FFF721|nr:hypothetical protein [Brevibacillus dissolubilis]